MHPKLTIVDSPNAIPALIEYLADKDFVAYDCETTGTHQGAEVIGLSFCASEDEAFYVILEGWSLTENNGEGGLITYCSIHDVRELLEVLATKKLIMHNAVFDAMMAEFSLGVPLIQAVHTDTMILAHLLDENRRVGLKELAKEYFGESSTIEQAEMKASVLERGGKLTKDSYEMWKAAPLLLAKYGAKDAWLTYKLFYELVPELFDQGLDKFFYDDESMPMLRGPTYDLNTTGLRVDQQAMTTLKKTLEAECAEAKHFIETEIKKHVIEKYPGDKKTNRFNIGSSKQLSWLLFGKLGLEFDHLTDAGKLLVRHLGIKCYTKTEKRNFIHRVTTECGQILSPEALVNGKKVKAKLIKSPWDYIACDKKTLKKLAPKHKWIEKLLEYQRKMKILSTYIEGIESRIQYGIIRPGFLQHGTTSGRYASRNPNFQNLPRDDKRVKQCIVPRNGKVFVGADYSQLEPRVFAYYSGDKRLLAAFDGTTDFYSTIGMEVYDKFDCTPHKDGSPDAFGVKYKSLRDLSKVIALASTYGATAYQLAPTTGKSVDDTQEDINKYFERFPGVAEMMKEAHLLAKKNGFVVNLFGRKRRMPDAKKINKIYGDLSHGEYPYEVRNILNLAVNHRIQSTGASIVNRAAIKFLADCKELGFNVKLVLQVHDSLVAECDAKDGEDVSLLLQNAMEMAVELKGVRLEAIPKIGHNLAEV